MDNLSSFVKMAIISNPNLDNKAVETLCKYVDDLEDSVYVLENQYRVQSEKNDIQKTMIPFDSALFTLSTHKMNNGFSIMLPNDFVVSVRWGDVNYCSNRYNKGCTLGSQNAEVAIFDPNNKMVGDVYGYVDPAMLLDLLNKTANMKETN